MMPKTLQRRNYELLSGTDHFRSATGDHNQDLYYKSKEQEKRNKESDEYWYERAKGDCTFAPYLEKDPIPQDMYQPRSVAEVPNSDKYLQRMKKAREDAIFKKKMTERSNFSATQGVKKAKTAALAAAEKKGDFLVAPAEKKKFGKASGFGGVDGAQILPPRNTEYDSFAPRPPLHLPKTGYSPKAAEKKPKKAP